MKLDEIKALIAMMGESGLAEMTVSENGWKLHLVRDRSAPAARAALPEGAAAPLPTARPAPAALPSRDVAAPLAGVVHLRPSPEAAPFVEPGQAVRAGDALCLIEAMKVFNTVYAERDGAVAAVLVTSGDEVEAGQPLLRFA
jgi:acetyl-CoA carboxylase biotin carboxyl carrier protein